MRADIHTHTRTHGQIELLKAHLSQWTTASGQTYLQDSLRITMSLPKLSVHHRLLSEEQLKLNNNNNNTTLPYIHKQTTTTTTMTLKASTCIHTPHTRACHLVPYQHIQVMPATAQWSVIRLIAVTYFLPYTGSKNKRTMLTTWHQRTTVHIANRTAKTGPVFTPATLRLSSWEKQLTIRC